MRTIALLAGAAVAAGLLSAPAAASITVVGNSVGYGCYQSALNSSRSQYALQNCDYALQSGLLNARDTVATYVNRGIIKINRANYDAAIADLDKAIRLDPDEPESYLNKGSALIRKGADPALAIPLFDEALKRETRRPELAFYARAVAHELAGNVQAAYNDYRRAQQAAPEWEDPGLELSRFQVRPASGSRF